jgi:hypothetical protein
MSTLSTLKRQIGVLRQLVEPMEDWKIQSLELRPLIDGLINLSRRDLTEQELTDLAAYSAQYNAKYKNGLVQIWKAPGSGIS